MLQIATFELPADQDKANEFLRTHKPVGEIARMGDILFIAFDNGEHSVEYEIANLLELIQSARNVITQLEISIQVMEFEKADMKPGKQTYNEILTQINQAQHNINIQQVKIDLIEKKVAALRAQK